MKKLSIILAFSFLFQSFAFAAPKESLKNLLDEYQYALTVEWDQEDEVQLEKIQSSFSKELKALVAEENLTMQELREVIRDNQKKLNLSEGMMAFLETSEAMDAQRAQAFLEEHSHLMYREGASWTSSAGKVALWGFGALVVFEIIVLIATTPDDLCPNPDSHPNDISYECHY